MWERTRNNLDSFLKEYSIQGARIFRDWLLKQSGLPDECQKHCHFYVYEDYDDDTASTQPIYLRLRGLDADNRAKLLSFLEITEDDVKGNLIPLNEELVFNRLLPNFKNSIKTVFSDNEIEKYQMLSKASFKEKYKQEESLNDVFFQEIEDYLAQYKITVRYCDIFEHTLLDLIGIDHPDIASFNPQWPPFRNSLSFYYSSNILQLPKQFIEFFHNNGDSSALCMVNTGAETSYFDHLAKEKQLQPDQWEEIKEARKIAKEKHGYYDYYSAVKFKDPYRGKPCRVPDLNSSVAYRFSVDAKVLRETIWPKMKKHISDTYQKDPKALAPYQEASKRHFEKKEKSQTKRSTSTSPITPNFQEATNQGNPSSEKKEILEM
ncbi:hypothetical protein L3V79_07555 [Thiotrichales bacterium 19S9-12]|nr:hypothetical protein [Thiotrichales bacterium 19S9-11]MCF6812208.1 hypothetical protein [Thiotrichales bacterium 19S9-12]